MLGNLMAYNNNIDEGWVGGRRLRKCCTTCVTRLTFIREHPVKRGCTPSIGGVFRGET